MSDYVEAMQRLETLQKRLAQGEITNREYEKRNAQLRREYGLRGWNVNTND